VSLRKDSPHLVGATLPATTAVQRPIAMQPSITGEPSATMQRPIAGQPAAAGRVAAAVRPGVSRP
jgi:hypothetical protein